MLKRLVIFLLMLCPLAMVGWAVESVSQDEIVVQEQTTPSFEPFTGKVAGNRVRVRINPDLSSHIIKELSDDDLVAVVGEDNDYYAIKPFGDAKAYVFRTYVLDDVVEGSRVNVRLEPDLNSPVIAQLNTGDPAKGVISPINSKWLEIDMPEAVVFYISKDYVSSVGGPDYLTKWYQREQEAKNLLNAAYLVSQSELRKPFSEISLEKMESGFMDIVNEYVDFKDQVAMAEEGLEQVRDAYLQKKVVFLEKKVDNNIVEQQEIIVEGGNIEPVAQVTEIIDSKPIEEIADAGKIINMTDKMRIWEPIEDLMYNSWLADHPEKSISEFYTYVQDNEAIKISGIVEPYNRAVKNKPGDFILRDSNHLPVAYLYSTRVDLQNLVGQHVNVVVSPRPNNNFAFPAYFVLSVE